MSFGRRGFVLSVAFVGLVLWLCPAERARAQPVQIAPGGGPGAGKHRIWSGDLTPEQVRRLLAQFGQGDKNADDFLEEMIRKAVKDKNPNANDKQVSDAIKKMLGDKELMDRVKDLAQRHKNQNPNQQPGEFPKLTPEDFAKLKSLRPDGNGGDPFQIPKVDPNQLPKFELDPRTGKPFDPVTGKPIDPNNPPKFVEPPKDNLPVPPPPVPDQNRKFDPNNPLGPANESPEKLAKTKTIETATALWEKNVGPIDESPAVKRALLDLVSDPDTMNALTDGKGNSIFDLFRDSNGEGFKDLFGGGDGKGWEWPKFDFKLDWGKSPNINLPDSNRTPRVPDLSGSGPRRPFSWNGSFDVGGLKVPSLLVLLLLVAVVAAVVWWKWDKIFPPGERTAFAVGGPGQWPLDPRSISTREDVVKAFEYLSVLICGPGAKTWTHSTVADHLSALAATHGETAVKLARLYELARYAPLDEPLTRAEIVEARRLVCDLAGVDE